MNLNDILDAGDDERQRAQDAADAPMRDAEGRATNAFVTLEGGSFMLSLQEMRTAEPHDHPPHYVSAEFGRFALSPVT